MKIQRNKGVDGKHKNVLYVVKYYTYFFKRNMTEYYPPVCTGLADSKGRAV